MNLKKHIPNALTTGNLICGCIGITFAFHGELIVATYLIWAALIFDFLDGFVARLLKVSSPIGKELDSLADMVTFGVLPGVIIFQILFSYNQSALLPYIAYIIPVFSAFRLAKFNIDDRQQSVFIGLPTPANALFISSMSFIVASQYGHWINFYLLLAITIVFSLLLVSTLEMFSLKVKSPAWRGNQMPIIFIIISLLLLVIFRIFAIPLIILLYIALSIVSNFIAKPSD